jgi:hypothetical protein
MLDVSVAIYNDFMTLDLEDVQTISVQISPIDAPGRARVRMDIVVKIKNLLESTALFAEEHAQTLYTVYHSKIRERNPK